VFCDLSDVVGYAVREQTFGWVAFRFSNRQRDRNYRLTIAKCDPLQCMGPPIKGDDGKRRLASNWFPDPFSTNPISQMVGRTGEVDRLPIVDRVMRADAPIAGEDRLEVGVGSVREPDTQVQLDW